MSTIVFSGCTKTKTDATQEEDASPIPKDTIETTVVETPIKDSLDALATQRIAWIKQSFLKALYTHKVAKLHKDSLVITIPFDLHSNDHNAPDCYTTTLQFQIAITNTPLQFPENLPFYESVSGCVAEETNDSGVFELQEATPEVVIYYAKKLDRTLVLLRSNEKSGTYAYYFDTMPYRITSKNWNTLLENFDETEHISYPYRSSILTVQKDLESI